MVTSAWTGKVPTAVTIALGTNVKQIGAKITYKRFDKDVWFPVQTGGEMKLRVLFLYARTIAFSATNRDFRKADVQSSIQYSEPRLSRSGAQSPGSVSYGLTHRNPTL